MNIANSQLGIWILLGSLLLILYFSHPFFSSYFCFMRFLALLLLVYFLNLKKHQLLPSLCDYGFFLHGACGLCGKMFHGLFKQKGFGQLYS